MSYNEFIKAICDGDVENVNRLFHADYLDLKDKSGENAIHRACKNNHLAIVKFLLEKNFDCESCDECGMRPIHIACANNNIELIKLLISYNCELECKTKDDKTPLIMTKDKNCKEILEEARTNKPIALAMNLKCQPGCNHKCCLSSVLAGTYTKDFIIGQGRFAEVFQLTSQDGQEIAVKEIAFTSLDLTAAKSVEYNINSYRQKILHERIVKFIGAIKLRRKIDIYMEYMPGGSLDTQIRSCGALPHQDVRRYTKQILEGVAFLHEIKIVHRDIKPANILLGHNKEVKIGDFGYSLLLESIIVSRRENKNENVGCGTVNYMAPEILRHETFGYAADIWSIGATVVHMLTGRPPFQHLKQNLMIIEIGNCVTIDFVPARPISDQMQTFVKRMLTCPKENRPTAQVLLQEVTF